MRRKPLVAAVAVLGMIASALVFAGPASAAIASKITPNHVTFTQGTAASKTVRADGTDAGKTITCEESFPVDCFGHLFVADEGLSYSSSGSGATARWHVHTDGTTPVGTYTALLDVHNASGLAVFTFKVYVVPAPQITVNPTPTIFHGGSPTVETATITSTTSDNKPVRITCSDCGTHLPDGLTFSNTPAANPGLAYISGRALPGVGGAFTVHLTATSNEAHNGHGVTTEAWTIQLYQDNTITPSGASFTVGTTNTRTITAHGYPYVTSISCADCLLPAGLNFADNGNGTPASNDTAKVFGDPSPGTGGVYTNDLTLHNGVTSDTIVPFTITVNEAPSLATAATYDVFNTGFSFQVSTVSGWPISSPPMTVTPSGLPPGTSVSLGAASGNSRPVLISGSCTHCGGSYPITFTAHNGIGPDAVLHWTLNVFEAPYFNPGQTGDSWTATQANSVTVTTDVTHTWPLPAHLYASGAPSWLNVTDHGDGTVTLSGTPQPSDSGYYAFGLSACTDDFHGAASTICHTETYTIFVRAPVVTLPSSAPASDGQLDGVSPTTTPNSTVSWTGTGFAPYAPVTIGFYPTSTYAGPVATSVAYANGSGIVTFAHAPNLSGLYDIVAAGYRTDGTVQDLTNQTNFTNGPIFGF